MISAACNQKINQKNCHRIQKMRQILEQYTWLLLTFYFRLRLLHWLLWAHPCNVLFIKEMQNWRKQEDCFRLRRVRYSNNWNKEHASLYPIQTTVKQSRVYPVKACHFLSIREMEFGVSISYSSNKWTLNYSLGKACHGSHFWLSLLWVVRWTCSSSLYMWLRLDL